MRLHQIIDVPNTIEYIIKFHNACRQRRLKLEQIGLANQYSILKTVINPSIKRTLLITAGIHGDEPAGPIALTQFVERGSFPFNLRLIILPLLNPSGFAKKSRYNKQRRDLNRTFNREVTEPKEIELFKKAIEGEKIDLMLSMHEDDTHDGTYLYTSDQDKIASYKRLLKDTNNYLPTEDGKSVYGDKSDDGVIYIDSKNHKAKHTHSLEYYMQDRGIQYVTFETPGKATLHKRILAQICALQYLIKNIESFI